MRDSKKKYRILIVDDSPENIDILLEALSEYDCNIALNGKKAMETFHTDQQIDLILLDVVMPILNGFEVIKYLKHDPKTKDIPVIFLTGKSNPDDIKKGFKLGAVDYITKPFLPELVKVRVKNNLELLDKFGQSDQGKSESAGEQVSVSNFKKHFFNKLSSKFRSLENSFRDLERFYLSMKHQIQNEQVNELDQKISKLSREVSSLERDISTLKEN
jgi:CheY-like chemotaxis protein